ncbi:hypothetical protein D9758_015728 [Tetrapyrgos nigripes]|uniref:Major facilitator superfamily (MFS) profile domain-containing protein n=1 Tax=Tetrapyrgos nigripes TaxID=182062 RepID=A0A8H5FS69_9AGAR|nr:hypothetical protein D9758_015728 [Tetrapyrgos nigripes]
MTRRSTWAEIIVRQRTLSVLSDPGPGEELTLGLSYKTSKLPSELIPAKKVAESSSRVSLEDHETVTQVAESMEAQVNSIAKETSHLANTITTLPTHAGGNTDILPSRSSTSSKVMNEAMTPAPETGKDSDLKDPITVVAVHPVLHTSASHLERLGFQEPQDHLLTGRIASWRGGVILATACFAQLFDNTWVSAVNIAIPGIADDFDLMDGSQSWLLSAYTLTFGGFLLLSGVLSDRFGRRLLFSGGMAWMAIFTIACGVSTSGVQCIVFRALQGLGAAASVPSAIGVLSSYFTGKERHRALSVFGAAGVVLGLILGGLLTGTLGWRYIFYINAPMIFILAVSGWLFFPKEVKDTEKRPSLDFLGAALGTSGIILMTFALSQSEISGWSKAVVISPLIISIFVLLSFAWVERKVKNPIMLPSFASVWCSGFLLYCWWASILYFISLIAQEVLFLSPLTTSLYLIPMGIIGLIANLSAGYAVEKFDMKTLLIFGFLVASLGTLPAAFVKAGDNFFPLVFPTTMLCVIGVSLSYNVASIALVSAVPSTAKSLAGGLINTAFQIGSGFGLAITSVVNESVLKKQVNQNDPNSVMKGYQAALFTSSGLVGASLVLSVVAVRAGQQTVSIPVH